MKSKSFLLIQLLGLAIIGSVVGWRYIKSSPQFSLYKMSKAIEARDYETFAKYFDTDSVVDNIVDKALESVKEVGAEEATSNVWYELGKSFSEGLIMMMKPTIKEQAKAEIKREIETGSFWDDYRPVNVFKAFTGFEVRKEGKVATVTLATDEKEPFSFKILQREGYWQISDFVLDFNLPELSTEGR